MLAVPREALARIHASSGTTGKPTVVAYTAADLELFGRVNARSLAMAGVEPGMTLHNAYGYGLFTGGLGLHAGGERLGANVVPVSGGMTERQLTLIEDLRPDAIACTPSYALTLASAFAERGLSPDDLSLRFAVVGAEPWTERMRAEIDAGLGVRTTNIYGLSEIIGPGVSCECVEERSGSHVNEDHFLPEIVDPESGEPLPEGDEGVLVLTTLTKEALPLVRYWTGDICSLRSGTVLVRPHLRPHGADRRPERRHADRARRERVSRARWARCSAGSPSSRHTSGSSCGATERSTRSRWSSSRTSATPCDAGSVVARTAALIRETIGCSMTVKLVQPGRGAALGRRQDPARAETCADRNLATARIPVARSPKAAAHGAQVATMPSGNGESFSAPSARTRKLSSTRRPPPPSI